MSISSLTSSGARAALGRANWAICSGSHLSRGLQHSFATGPWKSLGSPEWSLKSLCSGMVTVLSTFSCSEINGSRTLEYVEECPYFTFYVFTCEHVMVLKVEVSKHIWGEGDSLRIVYNFVLFGLGQWPFLCGFEVLCHDPAVGAGECRECNFCIMKGHCKQVDDWSHIIWEILFWHNMILLYSKSNNSYYNFIIGSDFILHLRASISRYC